jgi:PAS domain S-box-containing protein
MSEPDASLPQARAAHAPEVCGDLSDRRRAEEALQESEERLRRFFEASFEALVFHDEGAILDANQAFADMFGYALPEVVGKQVLDLAAPEFREEVRRRIREGDGRPYEAVGLRKDGSTFPGELRGRRVRYKGREVRVTAVRDVTERRRVEEALRASEERFRQFMDNGPAVAWIKDERGRHLYVNRRFEQEHGLTPESVRGRDAFALFPPEVARQFHANDRAVLEAGRPLEFAETLPGPGGVTRHVHVYKFPFRDAAGTLYVGGMAVDVTEQRQAQEQLREYARRLLGVQEQERRHLARELHDEVGQVLTGLRLTLEACRALFPGEPPDCLADAEGLLAELARRVRDLSLGLRPSMLDDLGLLPALLWLCERYTPQTGVRVHFEHRGLEGRRFGPEAETAAFRITQEALTNVARHAGVKDCAARVWVGEDALRVQVEDQGSGFDPAAAQGSSGGLSGMAERAALAGGTLRVESAPGAWTRLTAELPVGPGRPAAGG